jgi:phosphoribosyl-dephospho-CoA transferase
MMEGRAFASPLPPLPSLRGGEADEAIQGPVRAAPGLLRCARNDGVGDLDKASLPGSCRPHDLVWVDPATVAELVRDLPSWATAALATAPWVVVRRVLPFDGLLPVGIRGSGRSERCAAWLPPAAVVERRTPEDLAAARAWQGHPRLAEIPALAALDAVATLLDGWNWGPAGSVGFELATGQPTANSDSDLDILLRASSRLGSGEAGRLLTALATLPVHVDVAVETPLGACSLAEIAAGGAVVVKTPSGPRMVRDPWAEPTA